MSDDSKSARKFLWILMLLPLGLAVGSVTSLVNHLSKNEEQEAQEQFKVALDLDEREIKNAMQKALVFGRRDLDSDLGITNAESVKRFIRGDVSPGGTGQQWSDATVASFKNRSIKLSYTDILGKEGGDVVVVVIELVGVRNYADVSKLGMTASLIRSLLKDKPLRTIRFVLTPITASAKQHAEEIAQASFKQNQTCKYTIVLKAQDSIKITDIDGWKDLYSDQSAQAFLQSGQRDLEMTHPVLRRAEIEQVSDSHSQAVLEAAVQLRALILEAANAP